MNLEDLTVFLTDYLVPFMNGSRVEFPIGVADDASIDELLHQRLIGRGIHLWEHIRSRLLVSLEVELGHEAQSGIAVVRLRPHCPLGASALVVEAIGHCHMRLRAIGFIDASQSPFSPIFNAVRWPHGIREAFAPFGRRHTFFRPWVQRYDGGRALGIRGGRVRRQRGRRELRLSGRQIAALRRLCRSPPAPVAEVVPNTRQPVAGERLHDGLEEVVVAGSNHTDALATNTTAVLADNPPDIEIVGHRQRGDTEIEPAAIRILDGPSIVIHYRPIQLVDLTGQDEGDPDEVTFLGVNLDVDALIEEGLVSGVPGNVQFDSLDIDANDFE